jgi:hypothetical protein
VPPHCPYSATADAADEALVVVEAVVDGTVVEVDVGLVLVPVEPPLEELPAGAEPASGPAILVVIVPLST